MSKTRICCSTILKNELLIQILSGNYFSLARDKTTKYRCQKVNRKRYSGDMEQKGERVREKQEEFDHGQIIMIQIHSYKQI